MRQQGGPSLSEKGCCMYRGDGDSKCFFGAAIPDAHYSVDIESRGVTQGTMTKLWKAIGYELHPFEYSTLLTMQWELHDNVANAWKMDQELKFHDLFEVALVDFMSRHSSFTLPDSQRKTGELDVTNKT
jgi:hypothetical protein